MWYSWGWIYIMRGLVQELSSSSLRRLGDISYFRYDQQAFSQLRLSKVCKRRLFERLYVH